MTEQNSMLPIEAPDPQTLEPRTIEQLVQNQTRELDLRTRELELQQQQDRHNFEFSKAALATQAQDRESERGFQKTQRRDGFLLVAFVAIVIVGIMGYALWLNKDDVAMEIIKSIMLFLSGGGTGYALGKHQSKTPTKPADPDA